MSSNRLSQMTVDLGGEAVELERVEAIERLSKPFAIYVGVVSQTEFDLYPHLGKPCALSVYEDGELLRELHGYVTSGEYVNQSVSGHHYRLTLRPFTHFLDQNRDMAIYQEMNAPDIIAKVLSDAGVTSYRLDLTRSFDKRIYTVQYQESDFAFISRLMEEEGVYYFFEHSGDKHELVMVDAASAHPTSVVPVLVYNPNSMSVFAVDSAMRASGGRYYLQSWSEIVSTGGERHFTLRDFDFTQPDAPLKAKVSTRQAHQQDDQEVYHYPGNFQHDYLGVAPQQQFGSDRADTMLKGLRAQRQVYIGNSQSSALTCGTKTTVTNHKHDRFNGDYLVTAAQYSFVSEKFRSGGGGGGGEESFNVRFEAIPYDTSFQPPQTTPRPRVQGLESAIVCGPPGETIYTDEYGRVKVQFHWDREGKRDDKSTCWIRVSQTGGLGNIILPRIGHEVLIDFLHGDPDRPVVVGRVFNESNRPIYDLPENKTRALWRTKTYGETGAYPNTKALDTGAPGCNELRFEDKGGKEEIFLHAERDMNTRIRFDETRHVGHNQHVMIGYDRKEEVLHDETITIGNNRKEQVGVDEEIEIKNNQKRKVGKKHESTIGMTYKLTAGKKITLVCGQSKIEMTPSGITISSVQINVTGNATVDVKAPMTTVNASGILKLKGSLTTIN